MNTPNHYLWELIKSMSPAEKRYFKVHFSSEGKQHTLLFDHLNAQNSPNEEQAKSHLSINSSQFKVIKAQLYEIIIKSLIAQKGKRNLKSTIRLGLEEVDLLLEREHYDFATKKLRLLSKKCAEHGLTLYQYEITERLHEIQHLELDFSEPETLKHYEQIADYQIILQQKQFLSGIQTKLAAWTPFMPMRHQTIRKLSDQLYDIKAESLDFSNILIWFQSMASCLELLGQVEESITIRQQILSLFEQNKRLQNDLPLSYLNALKQASSTSLSIPSIKKVNQLTERAQRIISVFPQYTPHYIYFLWARLQAYYRNKQWTPITQTLDERCMSYIEKYKLENINTTAKILVTLATVQLITEHFTEAEERLKLFKRNKVNKDKALIYTVNILELCLHWEQKNMEKLIQCLNRFKRQLRSNKDVQYSNLYNIHLQLFTNLIRSPFLYSEKASEILLRISEEPYDPILAYYSLFNLERWLQAAAARKKWRDITIPKSYS